MKAPICNFCLTSEVLCLSDQTKLDSGEITHDLIRVSRTLKSLEQRHRGLADAELTSVTPIDDTLVAYIKLGTPIAIPEFASLDQEAQSRLGSKLILVEQTGSQAKLVQEIMAPCTVYSQASAWLPDGTRVIKVRAKQDHGANIQGETLQKIARQVLGSELYVDYA